jgi:hypothetical protein
MDVAGGIVVAIVLAVGMMTVIELIGRGLVAMMEKDND